LYFTAAWLLVQGVVALTGFYTVTDTLPPRFALLLFPPILFIIALFSTKKGRAYIDGLDARYLTLLHIVRIPIEIGLYFLFVYKTVPQIMTFEGNNLDILSGIAALFIFYFGYINKKLGRIVLLLWNVAGLLLLLNIVITAVLSAPFVFQQFGFDQPDIALLYFPIIWLPCYIVPLVLFSHLAAIRQLLDRQKTA
jgi:hypothetical protein